MSLEYSLIRASQRYAAQFIIDNKACGLFSDMGFGKTVAVTTAIEKMFRLQMIRRVLVVSTLRVARDTWPEELSEWRHTSYLRFKVIAGDADARLRAARGREQIHMINQENFVWLAEQAGRKWPYDVVIFDDAAGFKSANRTNAPTKTICMNSADCPIFEHEKSFVCNHADYCSDKLSGFGGACLTPCQDFSPVRTSLKACIHVCRHFKSYPARYTRFGALCALRPQIDRLVHLTGTPSSKGLLDLWPLIFTLDKGARLKKTYSQYKNTYFIKSHNGFNWNLKPGAEKEIHARVKDICIYIESEADLPPRRDIAQYIRLPKAAAEKYDEFKRDLILNLDGNEIVAANNGVLSAKLLQVCGGAVYTGEGREWIELHREKFKALDKIINRYHGEPIMIGYNFEHELIRLKAAYPDGVDIRDRRDAVHAWNAGDIPKLFIHPLSGGHGLNLQKGPGHVLAWFGLNWSLDLNKQLNKRLHRPGQEQEVFIYYLIVKGKADTLLMDGVAKYDWTQLQLLNALKRQVKEG